MPGLMPAKTLDVFEYLKQCAGERRTATYLEIADEVGLMPMGLGRQLNYIRDEICRPKGLPWLSALAVNEKTRMPGAGWLPDETITSSDNLPLFWGGIVLQVFATNWSNVNLENPN